MGSELLIIFSQMPWKRRKKQPNNAGMLDHLFGEMFSSVSGTPEGHGNGDASEGHGDGGAPKGKDEEWISQSMQDEDEMDELYSTITSLGDIKEDEDHVKVDHLDEEATETMRHPISKRCLALYNNHNALFLLYCMMHDQDSLMDDAVQDLDGMLLEFLDLPELKQ